MLDTRRTTLMVGLIFLGLAVLLLVADLLVTDRTGRRRTAGGLQP